jgi:hypothetical protein
MSSKRAAALTPRHPDKPDGAVAPRPTPTPLSAPSRRSAPPSAQYGLWEMPGGFGITVLK